MITIVCINAKPIYVGEGPDGNPEYTYGAGLIEGKIYQSPGMEIDNETMVLCYRIPEIPEILNPLKMVERFREVGNNPHHNQICTVVEHSY